ncbi:MAG: redoxin domain-containing protein, partial [Halobacteriovoraceae bacterium]|nr:redoxin domain-containing protein [Halobacteriovoraceae bacterium]
MRKYFFFIMLMNASLVQASVIKGLDLRLDKAVEIKTPTDKPSVYYFLSAWCPCSQGTFDHLNSLQKKYKNFNFVGFHSSTKVPKVEALKYFAKYKIDFPIIMDNDVKYADQFKAVKTPH